MCTAHQRYQCLWLICCHPFHFCLKPRLLKSSVNRRFQKENDEKRNLNMRHIRCMHGASNKSQGCKMVALFSFAQDCLYHLHSPPVILIVDVVVTIVIVITAVISPDSSLVALVAPGVRATVWPNQVSAVYHHLLCWSPQNLKNLLQILTNKTPVTKLYCNSVSMYSTSK